VYLLTHIYTQISAHTHTRTHTHTYTRTHTHTHTPIHTQLLAKWNAFPGTPWLSDFLDTAAAALPSYSRSRIVALLEALAALGIKLDTSPRPRKKAKVSVSAPAGGDHTHSRRTDSSNRGDTGWGGVSSSSSSGSHGTTVAGASPPSFPPPIPSSSSPPPPHPPPPPPSHIAVLPKRAKWLRSVLRTFKSRRQPTARLDHLVRLQAAMCYLCTDGEICREEDLLKRLQAAMVCLCTDGEYCREEGRVF